MQCHLCFELDIVFNKQAMAFWDQLGKYEYCLDIH